MGNIKMKKNELIEKLAELEHKQWIHFSKNIAQTEKYISDERLKRWEKLWIPYHRLSERDKEQDRMWARKVLEIITAEMINKYALIGKYEEF